MSTIKVDTVRPVTADASLTIQGDSGGSGVTGLTIDSSGNASLGGVLKLKSSGNSITASDGTTAVLSESSSVVTLTANNAVIAASSSGDLVRITQTGTGNALVVEDETNPDSTPFIVDGSGNVLVGTTSLTVAGLTSAGNGVRFSASGIVSQFASNADAAAAFNRTSNDGSIVEFRKDGTTVGSIGSINGAYLYIGEVGGVGLGLIATAVRPVTDGVNADNVYDLGVATVRWDDIYATNGTIQTSDRNEKQDIEELTEAEQRVAVAAKALIRKYRWQSAVAKKGDEARIHFGIIAQDLQAAFQAEGLDAGRYGMFMSNTWWETSETYTDDEGVEQTRINTYDTAEEAPEGAVARTRLGVRYPELLAFIIAAI